MVYNAEGVCVHVCMSVCMYVSNTHVYNQNFEKPWRSFLLIKYISKGYGSSSYMKVIRSRSWSQEQKGKQIQWRCLLSAEVVRAAIRLRAKFVVSIFNGSQDIRGVPKFQMWVTWPPREPFRPNFAFFLLVLTAIRLRAKFELSSFNGSRDIRGFHNSKSGSRDPTWPLLT